MALKCVQFIKANVRVDRICPHVTTLDVWFCGGGAAIDPSAAARSRRVQNPEKPSHAKPVASSPSQRLLGGESFKEPPRENYSSRSLRLKNVLASRATPCLSGLVAPIPAFPRVRGKGTAPLLEGGGRRTPRFCVMRKGRISNPLLYFAFYVFFAVNRFF